MNPLHLLRCEIERRGVGILRIAVGIVFLWFGILKFFDRSEAEAIAGATVSKITFGSIAPEISLPMLAAVECIIGLAILTNRGLNVILPIMYIHMIGTLLPLALFPEKTWQSAMVPTLEGQYIIKNAVLIAAGIVIGAVARGGKLIADPEVAHKAKQIEKQKAEDGNPQ